MFNSLAAKLSLPLVTASVAIALASSPAYAGLEIQLQSDGHTYSQSGTSPLTMTQPIGNFTTTVNVGTATNTPALDLSSVDISSSTGGTLVVSLSGNDFTSPQGAAIWLSQFSGNFATGLATVTLQTYLDNSNRLLGTATLLSTLSASTTPFSLSDFVTASAEGPFAVTEVLTITTTGPALLSLDASVGDAPIPEPASMTLLGSSVIGLFMAARRKHKKAA
jgi:PEP-CTERM motif